MERQPRLSGVERIGQLADAPLSSAEQLDDLESGLVGKRVKELDRALGSGVGCHDHKSNISRKGAMSRRPGALRIYVDIARPKSDAECGEREEQRTQRYIEGSAGDSYRGRSRVGNQRG